MKGSLTGEQEGGARFRGDQHVHATVRNCIEFQEEAGNVTSGITTLVPPSMKKDEGDIIMCLRVIEWVNE